MRLIKIDNGGKLTHVCLVKGDEVRHTIAGSGAGERRSAIAVERERGLL